ncbi:unnamed protein product, partial [Staurois parvus]
MTLCPGLQPLVGPPGHALGPILLHSLDLALPIVSYRVLTNGTMPQFAASSWPPGHV